MTPDTLNLRLQRGTDTAVPILLMASDFRYAEITEINATAPLTITAPAHGLPAPEWPAWLEGTSSSQLNRDKTRQPFQLLTVLDDDTLEINSINGLQLKASGGSVVYHPPLDTDEWQFEALFYAADAELLTLRLGAGLTATAGGIRLDISVDQAEQLAAATRWELIVINASGRQRYLCGSVNIVECQRHDSCH
ncbi:MAG: hypothetical protein GXZ05_09810 [Gammaproteobacteria bacterium]|nr:hypothetical protein [Gammaproteobacteria bacterium]